MGGVNCEVLDELGNMYVLLINISYCVPLQTGIVSSCMACS